jgi:hypothetical protein
MSDSIRTMLARGIARTGACVACATGLLVLGATALGCGVGVEADYPAGYYADYPPDDYIATTEPVYYDGYPAYWYGGFWYYRGPGGRWNHYDREPSALYDRRMRAAPGRRVYERSGGHFSAGRGGGRGGGRR